MPAPSIPPVTSLSDLLDVAAFLAVRIHAGLLPGVDAPRDSVIAALPALERLTLQWHAVLRCEANLSLDQTDPSGSGRQQRPASEPSPDSDSAQPQTRGQAAPAAQERATPPADQRRRQVAQPLDGSDPVLEILVTEVLLRIYQVGLIAEGCLVTTPGLKPQLDVLAHMMEEMSLAARRHWLLRHHDFSRSLKLYRIQKRLDRWSDLLLAPTLDRCRLDRFRIDPQPGDEWLEHPWSQLPDLDLAAGLLRCAIQASLPDQQPLPPVRQAAFQSLLSAMFLLIPADEFTSEGRLKSLVERRWTNFSLDTAPAQRFPTR